MHTAVSTGGVSRCEDRGVARIRACKSDIAARSYARCCCSKWCLCSGCVTSAEAVLISAQSADEFLENLQSETPRPPANRSIAAACALKRPRGSAPNRVCCLIGPTGIDRGLLSVLGEKKRAVTVVTVAPQSLASLAVSCGMPMDQAKPQLVECNPRRLACSVCPAAGWHAHRPWS